MNIFLYLLIPFSWLYQFLFFVDRLFKKKFKIKNAIVISVGNLTTGGTGKTPFVILLSQKIRALSDQEIYVLSRGYRGKKSATGMLVETDSRPEDCGDEPLLIKKMVPFIRMIVGRDRYAAYRTFVHPGDFRKIVILDDGFQHHAIRRNYDFVLIDSDNQLDNGFTIPIGHLREKISALRRANAVVFTKVTNENILSLERIREKALQHNANLKFIYAEYFPEKLWNFKRESMGVTRIQGKRIFTFSGIGNPESFLRILREQSPSQTEFRKFPDHAVYSKEMVQQIIQDSEKSEFIICTEKDFVKIETLEISPQLLRKIFYLRIGVRIRNENELTGILNGIIPGSDRK